MMCVQVIKAIMENCVWALGMNIHDTSRRCGWINLDHRLIIARGALPWFSDGFGHPQHLLIPPLVGTHNQCPSLRSWPLTSGGYTETLKARWAATKRQHFRSKSNALRLVVACLCTLIFNVFFSPLSHPNISSIRSSQVNFDVYSTFKSNRVYI